MRLAVTLGDPAGIGPEVTEKALATFLAEDPRADVTLVGPANIAEDMRLRLASPRVVVHGLAHFSGRIGEPSAESGAVSLEALSTAMRMCKQNAADGIVTAPISKHALAMAGSADRGHTEILAREMSSGPTAMAFFSPRLRTVLVTVHVPLSAAIALLDIPSVVQTSVLFDRSLRAHAKIAEPRLALAALNPHAGEHGLLGTEEDRILTPAIAEARKLGVNLSGPHPADTLFKRAVDGEFDGVVALYHDQALIPMKLLGFGDAVNVTLGLSHPRTSPDHGTAFDIAGSGRADPSGMLSALRMAAELTS